MVYCVLRFVLFVKIGEIGWINWWLLIEFGVFFDFLGNVKLKKSVLLIVSILLKFDKDLLFLVLLKVMYNLFVFFG